MGMINKLGMVRTLVGNDSEATDAVIQIYLDLAHDAIVHKAYPFGMPEDTEDLLARYDIIQCKLAARYFLRRGAEGENTHIENGLHRNYESVDDADILKDVMQVVKVW